MNFYQMCTQTFTKVQVLKTNDLTEPGKIMSIEYSNRNTIFE